MTFQPAPVAAPLAVVDGPDAEPEAEVADAEAPVSEGPDDADAAVWAISPEVVVLAAPVALPAASILSRPAVMVTGVKLSASPTRTTLPWFGLLASGPATEKVQSAVSAVIWQSTSSVLGKC